MRSPQRRYHEPAPYDDGFAAAVLAGLSGDPKAIPCKFLYDARGSALFDAICALPEYYPARAETAIIEQSANTLARLMGKNVELIELGSGSSRKVRAILDRLESPAGYLPIDISGEHLARAAARIARDYPHLPVKPLCADYTAALDLGGILGRPLGRRVAFFPGSTICNLTPDAAVTLMRRIAGWVGRGGDLVIGVDLKKDAALIEAAYNDSAGVTAAFNLNLLARINRELGGDFDLGRFAHEARYNRTLSRVEIHIRSEADQLVHAAGRAFLLHAGERIHTEYSYKYDVAEFAALAAHAGFRRLETWTDDLRLFSVHYLRAEARTASAQAAFDFSFGFT